MSLSKRKGFIKIPQLVLIAAMIALMSNGLSSISISSRMNTLESDTMRNQAILIDTSLASWYASHSGTYPSSLQVFKELEILPKSVDLSLYNYQTSTPPTMYKLTVSLPNGSSYKTPGSKW